MAALFLLPIVAACPQSAPPAAKPADLADVAAPVAVCPPEPDPAREKTVAAVAPALGLLRQPAMPRLSDKDAASAVYSIGEPPSNPPVLRPGPEDDRHLIEIYCIGCHSTAYIAMQPPLSRTQWEATVAKMRSAFGAVVPDPAAQRIATFLHSYYGHK